MTLLVISASILLIIFIIKILSRNPSNFLLNFLVVIGVLLGALTIGLNYLFENNFGVSTPEKAQVENLTDQNLTVYALVFWDNWRETGNYAIKAGRIKPNEKLEFWFENDATTEFWLVAKTSNNQIKYLNIVSKEIDFNFIIADNHIIDPANKVTAKKLTQEADKFYRNNNLATWINFLLISLLILSMFRFKIFKHKKH